MALAISNVPVLTGEVASRFVQEAEYNSKHLAGSQFSAEAQQRCMSIVERSRRFLEKINQKSK